MARVLVFILAPFLVLAQDTTVGGYVSQDLSYTTTTSSPTYAATTTSSLPVTHTIEVGKGDFRFEPNTTTAAVGDIIEFHFFPPDHSVIRADDKDPCIPYENSTGKPGFFSGVKFVDAILPDPPKWSLPINDTDPVFFYCGAPNSCIGHQMVGIINPRDPNDINTQAELARNADYMLLPGQAAPAEGVAPSSTSAASSTQTQPTASARTTAASIPDHPHSGLTSGAIAGIAIGGAAVVIIAAGLIYWCGRQSRKNNQPQIQHHSPYPPISQPAYYDQNKHLSVMSSQPSPGLPSYYEAPAQVPNSPPYENHQQQYIICHELPTEHSR